MYNSFVQQILNGVSSPGFIQQLADVEQLLLQAEWDSCDFFYHELADTLSRFDNIDLSVLASQVESIFNVSVARFFKSNGIVIIPETSWENTAWLIRAISGNNFSANTDALMVVAMADDLEPAEKFERLAEEACCLPEGKLAGTIRSITAESIDAVIQAVQSACIDYTISEAVASIAARWMLFRQKDPDIENISSKLLPGATGISFESLLDANAAVLYSMKLEDTAMGFVALASRSSLSHDEFEDELQFFVENTWPALNDQISATRIIKSKLAVLYDVCEELGV